MAILRVEPLTTARALRGPFDYRRPEAMAELDVGSVVRVPFGPRRILGVVVEVAEGSELPPERLAEPIEALEAGATPELVRLGLWVAREYCSTPSRGLQLVLPPGTGTGSGARTVRSKTELRVALLPAGKAALEGGERLGSRQRSVLEALRSGEMSAGELATAVGSDRQTLRRLEQRGLVATRKTTVRRIPGEPGLSAAAVRPELLPEQQEAVTELIAALDGEAGSPRQLLLHGVTGSGKTEVYLAAVEAALERGRGAIVLVPEIGLAPQAVARFRARLGDRFAVLHSALSAGERYDEWRRLRSGEAQVCVGPRSAVFAPVRELGLIVIDEEHEPSYKQEGDPRYDAREVARRRAGDAGAVLVAGSATPRPESWRELERLELPRRVDGRSLPRVDVLDMRDRDGREGPLHPHTRAALAEVRDREGKAIVLINRRGWTVHLSCRSCGRTWICPDCDVSLVQHRHSGLHCHHCGYREAMPESCPDCDSVTIARAGVGSERIEAVIAEAVGPLPVFRLDSDSAAGAGGHGEILGQFEQAPNGVLVGTQMVAKGHDFPDVVLGIVLDADATLRFPDFRAEERTFAMVAQLAGRSGRGERGGRVLVQTLAPEATAIRLAAEHDSAAFIESELERRRELDYPPFSHLIRIELTAADVGRLEPAARRLYDALVAALPESAQALGPAPRFRLRGRERRQILVKATDRAAAVLAIRETVEAAAVARDLRELSLSVDVDAQ